MPKNPEIKKVLVIGSGPIVIGQAAEFDYAGTQACRSLKEEGIEVVLLNSNPATIMTDKDIADRVYIEPLTTEVVEQLIKKEKPDSVLPTLGGLADNDRTRTDYKYFLDLWILRHYLSSSIMRKKRSNRYPESCGPGHASGWYWTVKIFLPTYFNPSFVLSFTFTNAGTATSGFMLCSSTAYPWFWEEM